MEAKLQEIVELVKQSVREEDTKHKRAEEKKEQDKRLRNTKLLLRNYHSFKRYADEHKGEDFTEETPVRELILNSQDIVASIRMTTKRTIIMIQHMDNALKALQFICLQEEKEDKPTSRHYEVLEKRFIDLRAIDEIAEDYEVNARTVYKLIDSASERLSLLLFGVYGLKVE